MPDPKPPSPAAPVSSTRMYRAKLALRILQFSLAITVLGCAGKILTSGVWGLPTILTITPQVRPFLPSFPHRYKPFFFFLRH